MRRWQVGWAAWRAMSQCRRYPRQTTAETVPVSNEENSDYASSSERPTAPRLSPALLLCPRVNCCHACCAAGRRKLHGSQHEQYCCPSGWRSLINMSTQNLTVRFDVGSGSPVRAHVAPKNVKQRTSSARTRLQSGGLPCRTSCPCQSVRLQPSRPLCKLSSPHCRRGRARPANE